MYLAPFPQNLQKYMNPIDKYVGKEVPKCLRCCNFDTFWKSVTGTFRYFEIPRIRS